MMRSCWEGRDIDRGIDRSVDVGVDIACDGRSREARRCIFVSEGRVLSHYREIIERNVLRPNVELFVDMRPQDVIV